jgi:hypothetical protein
MDAPLLTQSESKIMRGQATLAATSLCVILGLSFPNSLGAKGAAVSSTAARAALGVLTVGFDTKTGMGYGGMLTFNPVPVVLFRNGDALRDMKGLRYSGGLVAHRAAHPDQWTKWRRTGPAIELLKKDGWKKITYTKTMGPLPKGYALDGNYRSQSGAGTMAIGGGAAVVAWSNMAFSRAGEFATSGGAGASAGGTVTSSRKEMTQGRYAINGYTLTLSFADGRAEQRMIVTEIGNPKAIWIDGDGYVLR